MNPRFFYENNFSAVLDNDNSSLIDVIENNKENIDSTYYGNVYKFLLDYDKKNSADFSTKYKLIQRYTIFNDYTSEETQMIEYWKELLGYRAFLTERADKEECEYTFELYSDIKKQKKRLEKHVGVSTRFKNKYAIDIGLKKYHELFGNILERNI